MRGIRQTIIALAAAALLAGPAVAQSGQGGQESRAGQRMRAVAGALDRDPIGALLERREELELTAGQVARLEAVQARVERENAPRIERIRAVVGDLPAGEPSDEERARLRERVRELQPIREEIRQTNRAAVEEVRRILTAEQQTKIRSAMRRRSPAGPRGTRGTPVDRILRHREALGLTAEQVARLEAVRESQRAAREQVREEVREILTEEQESRLREMTARPRGDRRSPVR